MKVAIVSAANVASSGKDSISIKTALLLADRLRACRSDCNTELIDIRDYQLMPCDMCEGCGSTGACAKDEDFNMLLGKITEADEMIVICPHYAPIPSKLIIMFEKLEEMSYLQYCAGKEGTSPTNGKKAGIIAHGGMVQGYEQLYQENMLTPLINVMECIGMKVANRLGEQPICFGVKGFARSNSKITHDIIHDMENIEHTIDKFLELYNR